MLLQMAEVIQYDKRTFLQFFADSLKRKHPFFYAYWRVSLVEPQYIRLINFYLRLGFLFMMNALFFTDAAVESRNEYLKQNPGAVFLPLF